VVLLSGRAAGGQRMEVVATPQRVTAGRSKRCTRTAATPN